MSFLLMSAFFIFRWPGFLITETHTDMKSERGQRQSSGGVLQKRCSAEKVFLEISQNSQEKHLCQKKGKRDLKNFKFIKKDILARVLSCEFCEISKNTFFYRINYFDFDQKNYLFADHLITIRIMKINEIKIRKIMKVKTIDN